MRKWWSTAPNGVQTFTFSREMTPEEVEETSRRMDAAFAHMDKAFGEMGEMFDNLAKATPTQSAKTPKSGLVRRMVARCRNGIRPKSSKSSKEDAA